MSENQFDLLIRNGQVVTHESTKKSDIGVKKGKIVALDTSLPVNASQTIDATNKLVFPGFIDAHTHMGIPIKDTQSVDDFESGSRAAAFGGVTTIIDFTVQAKGQTLRESIESRIQKAEMKCHVDYGLHVNITNEPEKRLLEIPELIKQGYASFKVFSTYKQAGMMVTRKQFYKILKKVNENNGLLMLHAEDDYLVESLTNEFKAAGQKTPVFHSLSRTPDAEAKAIRQAAEIAGELNAFLYIVHLSSWDGLEAALEARGKGVNLYLETCPQYLLLTDECYSQENSHLFITTPPLRSQKDAESLWQAVAEGHIDVVATDHCPFTIQQKESGQRCFYKTLNGLPGVESLFPLLYTYGVRSGRITLEKLVSVLAKNPAQIFGLYPRKGTIQIGADADLVIWNPNVEQVIDARRLHGKADWSPYEGMKIAGNLEYTILRGRILVQGDEFVGNDTFGDLQISPCSLEIS